MPELSFDVKGKRPISWGCNEWEWRRTVADKVRAVIAQFDEPLTVTSADVEITFRMTAPYLYKADLDNLAKPILDTLFLPRNPQVKDRLLTGALFSVDDDRVFRLILEKCQVKDPSEEGASISIRWS